MITDLPILYLKKQFKSVIENRLSKYNKAIEFNNMDELIELIEKNNQNYFKTIEPVIYYNNFWDNYFLSSEMNKINKIDKIDKIYYINLKHRPDRNKHFIDQCIKAQINLLIVQRFEAIYGKDYNCNNHELKLFSNCKFKNKLYFKNAVGNQLSHYYILKE